MTTGTLLALLSALAFGVTAPLIERVGRGVGPFTTAALLYAGACASAVIFAGVSSRASGDRSLWRRHGARLVAIALVGAALAPALFAWGLQRAGATTGSLLLNLEAAFTVLLARALLHEPMGRRVIAALMAMAAGGVLLALDASKQAAWSALGALAVAGATAAWALDNTLTRALAAEDPLQVVASKGALGATFSGLVAVTLGCWASPALNLSRESRPTLSAVLALLACGATGYGLSLRLYLVAQRRVGAARTGSIFAIAPFVGALVAWAMGARAPGLVTAGAAALFAIGVFLHATERHRHAHVHARVDHEHAHRHDDGHHDHTHDPPFLGEHSHTHHHDRLEHNHEHAPDTDHQHEHDA